MIKLTKTWSMILHNNRVSHIKPTRFTPSISFLWLVKKPEKNLNLKNSEFLAISQGVTVPLSDFPCASNFPIGRCVLRIYLPFFSSLLSPNGELPSTTQVIAQSCQQEANEASSQTPSSCICIFKHTHWARRAKKKKKVGNFSLSLSYLLLESLIVSCTSYLHYEGSWLHARDVQTTPS